MKLRKINRLVFKISSKDGGLVLSATMKYRERKSINDDKGENSDTISFYFFRAFLMRGLSLLSFEFFLKI